MSHMPHNPNLDQDYSNASQSTIYLAGGCFWGAEAFIERILGVIATEVGYANSNVENPNYEVVCSGVTNAAETVLVHYDSKTIDLATLLGEFFKIIDPTSYNKQGGDVGSQYRTGIYAKDEEQLKIAKQFIQSRQDDYQKPILVEVVALKNYYRAENYHQKYLENNPNGYCHVDLSLL